MTIRIFAQRFDYQDPASVFAPLAAQPYSLFFDSAALDHPDARYSYILALPLKTLTLARAGIRDDDPFVAAKALLDNSGFSPETLPDLPPFQGGLAGLFGYDLARALEVLPDEAADSSALPDMALGLYDQVLAFDHRQKQAWLITQADDEASAGAKRAAFSQALAADAPAAAMPAAPALDWQKQFTAQAYQTRIQQVKDYIIEGDIFQANLSQHFSAPLPPEFCPYAHYQHLRRINPAPFAAFMQCGAVQIASASPERFLHCTAQGEISTKPIKGTAPRSADPQQDALNAQHLQLSEKDCAENAMITDLLRNDLSKCCDPASIEVPAYCMIESFTDVHHLVTTVRGQLRADQQPLDALRACFPGGSITGAPKIRAMEIIDALEARRRHAYCGCLALIGANGMMDSNILIRTLIFENGSVSFNVGGGITALSDPWAEYQETLDKARSLFAAFGQQGATS